MMRDEFSNYFSFFACPVTAANNAARAVTDWDAAFGIPSGVMSDGPTLF